MRAPFLHALLTALILFAGCSPSSHNPKEKLRDAPTIALVDANVIDGVGAASRPGQTILIQNGVIAAVAADVELPPDAVVVDLSGKTVLPGLIDMHGHLYANIGGAMQTQSEAYPALYLAGGVTTIFSPGEYQPAEVVELAGRMDAGETAGPRVLSAGPYFDGDPSDVLWIAGSKSIVAIEQQFDQWRGRIDAIKAYTSITEDQLARVIALAHQNGLFVTGHLESVRAETAVDLGIDGLEHGLLSFSEFSAGSTDVWDHLCELSAFDIHQDSVYDLFEKMVSNKVYMDPTIVTLQVMLPDFQPVAPDWTEFATPAVASAISRLADAGLPSQRERQCMADLIDTQMEFVAAFHAAGGTLVAGTDPVLPTLVPGYTLHREMQNLVDAGLTPMEALQSATIVSAQILGLGNDVGTIEVGKRADLYITDGNPSEDIRALSDGVMVFKNGMYYDPAQLRESAEGKIGATTR